VHRHVGEIAAVGGAVGGAVIGVGEDHVEILVDQNLLHLLPSLLLFQG
jgi:hypothetical protein